MLQPHEDEKEQDQIQQLTDQLQQLLEYQNEQLELINEKRRQNIDSIFSSSSDQEVHDDPNLPNEDIEQSDDDDIQVGEAASGKEHDNSDTEPESQLNSRLKGRLQNNNDDPDKIIDDLLANFIDHNANENESFTTTTTEQDNQRPATTPVKQQPDNSDTETATTYSTLDTTTTKNSAATTEDNVLSPLRNNLKTTIRKGLSFSRMDALEMPQRGMTPSTSQSNLNNNAEAKPAMDRSKSKESNIPVHITGTNSVLSQAYSLLKQAKQGTETGEPKSANLYRSPPGELLIRVLTLEFLEAAQTKIAMSLVNAADKDLQLTNEFKAFQELIDFSLESFTNSRKSTLSADGLSVSDSPLFSSTRVQKSSSLSKITMANSPSSGSLHAQSQASESNTSQSMNENQNDSKQNSQNSQQDELLLLLLKAVSALSSRHNADVMVLLLYEWRVNQHNTGYMDLVNGLPVEQLVLNSPSFSTNYEVIKKIKKTNDMVAMEEKKNACVDFLFCKSVMSIIAHQYDAPNIPSTTGRKEILSPNTAEILEDLCFKCFRAFDRTNQKQKNANKKVLEELYAQILGHLSYFRLDSIMNKFLTEIQVKSENVVLNIIEGIRYIKLECVTMDGLKDIVLFMRIINDNWKKLAGKKQQKVIFCDVVFTICRPLIDQPITYDYQPFYKCLTELYGNVLAFSKMKTKNNIIVYPLLTVILCLREIPFFKQLFSSVFETLIKFLKNPESRLVALESIYCLLLAYFSKIAPEEDNDTVNERLKQIIVELFPNINAKKYTQKNPVKVDTYLIEEENIEILVDIVNLISTNKLQFAVENIIMVLIESGQIGCMIIGFLAFMTIANRLSIVVKEATYSANITFAMLRKKKKMTRKLSSIKLSKAFRKNTLTQRSHINLMFTSDEQRKLKEAAAEEEFFRQKYLNDIGKHILENIASLDNEFGNMLLFHQSKLKASASAGKEVGSGLDRLDLFRTILYCLRMSLHVPLNLGSETGLISTIARQTLHINEGVATEAWSMLSSLMASDRPNNNKLRPIIVSQFAAVLLEIPENYPDLIVTSFKRLIDLIDIWDYTLQENPQLELGLNLSELEAVIFVFFCSHHRDVRILAFDVLHLLHHMAVNHAPNRDWKTFFEHLEGTADTLLASMEMKRWPEEHASYLTVDAASDPNSAWNHRPLEPPATESSSSQPNPRINQTKSTRNVLMTADSTRHVNLLHQPSFLTNFALGGLDTSKIGQPIGKEPIENPVHGMEVLSNHLLKSITVHSQDELAWARLLAAIIKILRLENCPFNVSLFQHLAPKFESLLNFLGEKGAKPTEDQITLWRNMLLVTSASVLNTDYYHDNKIKFIPGAVIRYKLMLDKCIPYLRRESPNDIYRTAVEMAIEFVDWTVTDKILLDTMEPLEKDVLAYLESKSKKRYFLHNVVLYIYRIALMSFPTKQLSKQDIFLSRFLLLIMRETSTTPPSDFSDLDELMFLRLNLCIIIGRVLNEINQGDFKEDLLGKEFRTSIFLYLIKCCDYGSQEPGIARKASETKVSTTTLSQKDMLNLNVPTSGSVSVKNTDKQVLHEQYKHSLLVYKAALVGLAHLLNGPAFDESLFDVDGTVFKFLHYVFKARHRKLHCTNGVALRNFLKHNPKHLEKAIDRCYSSKPNISQGYFLTVVDLLQRESSIKGSKIDIPSAVLLHLALYKLGSSQVESRYASVKLLSVVVQKLRNSVNTFFATPDNTLVYDTFVQYQCIVSFKIATEHPGITLLLWEEMLKRFKKIKLSNIKRNQVLCYMAGWTANMSFPEMSKNSSDQTNSVLESLSVLTFKYGIELHTPLQNLWIFLGRREANIGIILDYLIGMAIKKRNFAFIDLAKRVVVILSRVATTRTISYLLDELYNVDVIPAPTAQSQDIFQATTSKNILPNSVKKQALTALAGSPSETEQLWTLDQLFRDSASIPLSRSNIALMMLNELLIEREQEYLKDVCRILHLTFLHLDNKISIVAKHARQALINIIQTTILRHRKETDTRDQRNFVQETVNPLLTKLRSKSELWNDKVLSSDANVEQLTTVLAQVCVILQSKFDTIIPFWCTEAVTWLKFTNHKKIIFRSVQIFNALINLYRTSDSVPKTLVTHQVLSSLLRCLHQHISKKISDSTNNSRPISVDILRGLQVIIDTQTEQNEEQQEYDLKCFPYIFWTAVAMLHSHSQPEFDAACKLLRSCLQQLDMVVDSTQLIENVKATFDPSSVWQFSGIQKLVLKGITSDITDKSTVSLLSLCCVLPTDDLIESNSTRMVTVLIGLLPWLLSTKPSKASSSPHNSNNNNATENDLEVMIVVKNFLSLYKSLFEKGADENVKNLMQLLVSFTEGKYAVYGSFHELFVKDLAEPFCESFITDANQLNYLIYTYLEVLKTGPEYYKPSILTLLKYILLYMQNTGRKITDATSQLLCEISLLLKQYFMSNVHYKVELLQLMDVILKWSSISDMATNRFWSSTAQTDKNLKPGRGVFWELAADSKSKKYMRESLTRLINSINNIEFHQQQQQQPSQIRNSVDLSDSGNVSNNQEYKYTPKTVSTEIYSNVTVDPNNNS